MKLTRTLARRGASLATLAVVGAAIAGPAHAAAFYLQEQSTVAVGRAFSGEVSEQGAQQQWWNPAAVGGISGYQSYAGVTAILPHSNSVNTGTLVARPAFAIPGVGSIPASIASVGGEQNQHNPVNNGYLPNGGFAVPITDHVAFGFTATSPYSFTTNYDNNSWARYSADKTRLRTYDLQPVLAYSTGGLSIGAGPNVEYVRATFSNYLPDPLPAIPGLNAGNDGHQYLKGDGWDVGYSLGFQYHNDKVDIGASYKSKIKHTLKGNLIVDGFTDPVLVASGANMTAKGAKAQFTTPWQVNLGMRYHVTPAFTVEGQITRFGWSEFSSINLSSLGSTPNQSLPEDYKNTFSYALGFDYVISPMFTVRGGVQRDLSPIVDGERDPRVPDGPRWNFATGATVNLTQRMGLDLAASYDKIHSEAIDKTTAAFVGTPLQTVILTSGESKNARALVFSVGGHMSF
ncbi:outer membrane protein transport protein [uncultured Sphingomonas sp.]|uniref:OmpP1/FadL family transporter n=1 Tax=uncultured Sphingomonas sp. TaxID=158754 RepID=UPI00262A1B8F|nr:outer membrane protein transport protein [uncultured Sphingomonas sp.]